MYRVFSQWQYVIITLCGALLLHIIVMYAQSASLVNALASSTRLTVSETARLITMLFIPRITSPDEFLFAAILPLLFGVNSALLIFYFRFFRTAPSVISLGGGVLGAISAFLGIGCAACGSIFIAAFVATIGGGGLFALLPREGEEIGYIGLTFLALSSFLLVRAINKRAVCPI